MSSQESESSAKTESKSESPKTETVKTETTPVVATELPVTKKAGFNKIWIILIVVLLLCCCVTVIGLVAFAYFGAQKTITDSSSTINLLNTTPVVITDTLVPSNPTETKVPATGAFSMEEIKANYFAEKSYRFSGDAKFADGSGITFQGEFQAPNSDHYITTAADGAITEEISIDGIYYMKDSSTGGVWQKTTQQYNAGIQRDEMTYLFDNIDMNLTPKSTDANFYNYQFIDTAKNETWDIAVNKQYGLPGKVRIQYLDDNGESVVENLTFTMFGDTAINIKAPL